jgi:hypothetical protein
MKWLLLASLFTVSCVGPKQYRYLRTPSGLQRPCFASEFHPTKVSEVRATPRESLPATECAESGYALSFVEFDDQGQPWDFAQVEKTTQLIESQTRKSLVLVYVHGWQNNADRAALGKADKDVERFRDALRYLAFESRRVASIDPVGRPAVPIVGIFIGWRGKSLRGPGAISFPSFWPRRNAANRVGGKALANLLNRWIDTAERQNSATRIILSGHSFGARVLERAVESDVRLLNGNQPRVDLVLYVNSANDARLTVRRISEWRQNGLQLLDDQQRVKDLPLVLAVTSQADLATKVLLPLANTVLPDASEHAFALSSGHYADRMPTRFSVKKKAAGHTRFLHSHDAVPTNCRASTPSGELQFSTGSEDRTCYRLVRRESIERRPPFNQTPYWIVSVDKAVIKNHGDVWNQSLLNLLSKVIAPEGFFQPDQPKMQLKFQ